MSQRINSFLDLKAWQINHNLVLEIYKITKKFPRDEIYCLVNQMRRCVISVTSNIAEGFGRQTFKEKIQFYYIASGSLTELKNQLIISKDIGYINEKEFQYLIQILTEGHKTLNGFITKSKEIHSNFLNSIPSTRD